MYIPHPSSPEIAMALTIAHGTATAALDASSLMCTQLSNEVMVQQGARKLKMKLNPLGQPLTNSAA